VTLAIEAPTDAQLGYIASLCLEHGLQQPVDDEPEAPRPADEDMCGGRNTMTRSAPGDLAGYAD
jgi:hypothetical protein